MPQAVLGARADRLYCLRDRRLATIDEDELRERVAEGMDRYRRDIDAIAQRNGRFRPYLDAAYQRMWKDDVDV